MAKFYSSTRRTVAWSTAMRDHRLDRVAPSPGPNPMFLASLERARLLDAKRAAQKAAQDYQEGRS